MQLRKRDKIKKNIDVVINKDKNIIWNIDFSEDTEIYAKPPETLYESLEFYINKYEENLKNKVFSEPKLDENLGKKQLKRLAKKILKVKKLKLGEIAQKVEVGKNSLKLWFKSKLNEENEIFKIDSGMKIWVLMEMNTLSQKDLHELALKYFKKDDPDPNPSSSQPQSDSQDVIKNLLTTFFPKNKQLSTKSQLHSTNKVNGVWVMNKPPGKVILKEKEIETGEMIPITIKVEFDDLTFDEVILWDSCKSDVQEILNFSFLYLQDLMKEKAKYDIEKKELENLALKLAKDIMAQKEEYELLMKNSETLMSFQMASSGNFMNENCVLINLNINQDEIVYNDTFEWATNNLSNVETFIENLCQDLNFPEKIKKDLLIQIKQQILQALQTRFKKIHNTYQNIIPSDNLADLSMDGSEKFEEDSLLKKSLTEKKRLNLRKFSNGASLEDLKELKKEVAHTLTDSLPMIPENYDTLDETYYLQKNELYQFLEKNMNFISNEKKKILDTHSSFYKGFMSLMQHSRNQSQRIPSENRIMNYKNFDKQQQPPVPERPPLMNGGGGIAKPNYYPQPAQMTLPKQNNEANEMNGEKNQNQQPSRHVKPPSYNNYLPMPPPDYSKYQTYPYRKEHAYPPPQMQGYNKPMNTQSYSGQPIMTRSFQGPPSYNHQFLAMRNNYNVYPDPNMSNVNVYGNQMKITHNINPNLYNFQTGYSKYPQNIYMNSGHSMRMNNNPNSQGDIGGYNDEGLAKYHEEQQQNTYKSFNYLGEHIPKKLPPQFYPTNNTEHLYYKNLETTPNRENNDYLNGYSNNQEINSRQQSFNMNNVNEENLNEFQNFEKKKSENKMDIEENYLIGENDEFKIKRINSLNKFNSQKQIEDFLAISQEGKVEGTPELTNNRIFS